MNARKNEPVGFVRLERAGPLARLIIDNPRRSNALSRAMWREITALAAQLKQTIHAEPVGLLVLQSSTPGCFCAGADIAEFSENYKSAATTRTVNQEIHDAIDAIENCPSPTLALIDGPCVGGGLALALACDFRLASDNARFALTPSRLGLSYHPDDVRRLLSACGSANASELLFSAQPWSTDRALRAGLINELCAPQELIQSAEHLIAAICANSAQANRVLKQTLRSVQSQDDAAIDSSINEFAKLFTGPDFIAGRDAFLNKQPVVFPSNQPRKSGDE